MDTLSPLQSQERVAGLLAYVLFVLPILMGTKTDFTMFHAKQSLLLLVLSIIGWIIPFIGWILMVIVFLVSVWAAYQAYLGNKFVIPFLGDNMDIVYSKIGLLQFFSVK